MIRFSAVFLPLVLLVGACASSSSDTSASTSAGEVRVIPLQQLYHRDHEVLAQLEETAPVGIDGEDSARRTIEGRMRNRAARIDADAVAILECGRHVDPLDPSTRQGHVLICRSLAIRWAIPGMATPSP